MALYSRRLNGLSLCSGAGGLELGLHIAAPHYRTVGYVERDAFAASTLVARMADKALDQAPVWSDARRFDGRPWRGKVDILSAGYPCQPFTFSGQRKGRDDPRHLWPQVARIIKEISPRIVFCENVEGHLSLGFPEVAAELQAMGFDVRAGLFSAAEVGASHIRRRLFILAYANSGDERQSGRDEVQHQRSAVHRRRRYQGFTDRHQRNSQDVDMDVADVARHGVQGREDARLPLFAPAPCLHQGWQQVLDRHPHLQPCLFGLDNGMAYRVERSMLAGNGVCPLAAALAFRTLTAGVVDVS